MHLHESLDSRSVRNIEVEIPELSDREPLLRESCSTGESLAITWKYNASSEGLYADVVDVSFRRSALQRVTLTIYI